MKKREFACKCIDKYKDRLFILTRKTNELLVFYPDNRVIKCLGKLKSTNNYCSSCIVENTILYFSAYTNEVCEYNIEQNSIRYIQVSISGSHKTLKECWSCIQFKGSVYVTCGLGSEPLVKINPLSYEAEGKTQWSETFKSRFGKQAVIQSYGICTAMDCIWIPLNEPNIVLQYDPQDESFVLHEVPAERFVFHTIDYDGSGFWITGESDSIIKWNPCNNHVDTYTSFPEGFVYRKGATGWLGLFYVGFQDEESILYLPLEGNMCVSVDKKTGVITALGDRMDDKYCFHAFRIDDNEVYFEMDRLGTVNRDCSKLLAKREMLDFSFSSEDVSFSFDDLARGNEYSKNGLYYEEYAGMLADFIDRV